MTKLRRYRRIIGYRPAAFHSLQHQSEKSFSRLHYKPKPGIHCTLYNYLPHFSLFTSGGYHAIMN